VLNVQHVANAQAAPQAEGPVAMCGDDAAAELGRTAAAPDAARRCAAASLPALVACSASRKTMPPASSASSASQLRSRSWRLLGSVSGGDTAIMRLSHGRMGRFRRSEVRRHGRKYDAATLNRGAKWQRG
jgi:hypothetical protein